MLWSCYVPNDVFFKSALAGLHWFAPSKCRVDYLHTEVNTHFQNMLNLTVLFSNKFVARRCFTTSVGKLNHNYWICTQYEDIRKRLASLNEFLWFLLNVGSAPWIASFLLNCTSFTIQINIVILLSSINFKTFKRYFAQRYLRILNLNIRVFQRRRSQYRSYHKS